MSRIACLTALGALLVGLFAGCDRRTESSPAECADLPAVTWDGWAHGFFLNYCTSCHSAAAPDRHGAPAGMDFDSEAQVRAALASVRASVIEAKTMPVGGGVLEDDLVLLGIWLDCAGE